MSSNIEHADDWDAQRDALSAYLDGRLAPEESAALHRHVRTCARCARELVEVRQVIALLRALPRPALPRSFTIPVREVTSVAAAPPGALRTAAWPRVAQWAGGLVAAAGLLVGIAGTVGHVPFANFGAATSAPSTASAPQHSALFPPTNAANPADHAATQTRAASDGNYGPLLTITPTGVLAPSPTPVATQNGAAAQRATAPAPAPAVPPLPIAGGALLVVGATTFAAGTRARRRHR